MSRLFLLLTATLLCAQLPKQLPNGADLPNGWKITPVGKHVTTADYVLNVTNAPDGRNVIALHSGYSPHGLVVMDSRNVEITQKVGLKSAWFGLAWSPDGKKIYVSGGNAESRANPTVAPVYGFTYENGKLGETPFRQFQHRLPQNEIYWSGIAHHPTKPLIYAANRHTKAVPGQVVVFNTETGERVAEIQTEIHPFDIVLDASGKTMFVSNWASQSVSVVDTATNKVKAVIRVGNNPNDMVLAKDGRLFVACSNENSVYVIDTKTLRAMERISTSMYKMAPVGSTPNALALDPAHKVLFVANADNNNVAVINIADEDASNVSGFIPTAWYPSALTVSPDGKFLYIGSAKGMGGYSNVDGPTSPLAKKGSKSKHVGAMQQGSLSVVALSNLKNEIKGYTKQAMANCPYNDEMLARARPPVSGPSVVPQQVGAGSPIKHVIYIIKENRTYDQVFGDIPKGNGDPRLCIFGKKVTPNQHKLAEEFVLLDNLYCDGEVSVDGHSWSNSAYATDFNEKRWPPQYGGISASVNGPDNTPSSGHMWDLAAKKGLTYRSYGEYAQRVSDGSQMDAAPGVAGLVGHVSPKFRLPGMRDTDNVNVFLQELDAFEKNFDSKDPTKRLPNFSVMSLGENHTQGTRPGVFTPVAFVANNDWAVGQLVDRITHSRYWPETAIFIIEDDAQNGPDHVDARRTTGLVISPYTKRKALDSTLYTTSSMLRTMELLLGLPPMTQYDAAAMPMYASFTAKADTTPFTHVPPQVDVNAKNTETAWGARESLQMDFSDYDKAPEFALNEIIWKSVRGAKSEMPLPIRRFHFRY
ncbi:MAG: SMP-30/gluconolactonase/LRE family protein [Candidatus Solibacter usitatus]|nr:SMP-30/gluconolactonase/LRE family protein [Candidatus Solibacter usitatus]